MKIITLFKKLFTKVDSPKQLEKEVDEPLIVTGETTRKGNITINLVDSVIGLEGLTQLDGDLKFINTPENFDFSVFDELIEVTGSIVFSNTNLISIDGFNKLTTIGKDLQIGSSSHLEDDPYSGDFYLESINGFASLKSIGGRLIIGYHDNLINITNFLALETVEDTFVISDNYALEKAPEFPLLKNVVGTLRIDFNDVLKTLPVFPLLKSIGSDLKLECNENLIEVSGFPLLDNISGELNISECENLIKAGIRFFKPY